MTNQVLARARAGEEDAFRELTDPYRRELQIHIYRIVGSVHDAEDLLQETLLAAWRGLEGFEGRASVRAWLYQIATNRALDALRATRRRPEDLQRMTEMPEPTRYGEAIWLEPFPDVLLEGIPDQAPGPEAALRDQRGDRTGVHRRPSASVPAPARGAGAPRRARLPRGGGRRNARDHRTHRSTACCAAPARHSNRGCRPPDANGRRSPTPNASATPSAASPTRSKQATSRAWSPC